MTLQFNRRSELTKRRQLRHHSTEAERMLWQALRGGQLAVRFHRQYSVEAFVLDFYAPECKLALEVDGAAHLAEEGMAYDAERTRYLEGFDIEVVRVTNRDVLENLDGVLERIRAAVARRRVTSP